MPNQTAGKHVHSEKVGLWVLLFFFFFNGLTTYFLDTTKLRLWCPSSVHSRVGLSCVHTRMIETKGTYYEQGCHVLIQGIISLYLNLPLGY